jgi:hypothetical protein
MTKEVEMNSKKVTFSLSPVDRSFISNLIPKTGNVSEIIQYKGFTEELKFTDKELKIIKSFDQIHNKDNRDKAINEWYHTNADIELSEELTSFIITQLKSLNESHGISLDDPIHVFEEFDVK